MANLLDVFKPDTLSENGRFGIRVALIAADDEFQQILLELNSVVTPETRARLAALGHA
jgi:hypothetical protein